MATLFIDGDGCNAKVRILAERLGERNIDVVIVADRYILCTNPNTSMIVCSQCTDSTDNYILAHIENQDAVITKDLQLARLLLQKIECSILVVSDQGEMYTQDIIAARILRSEHSKLRRATLDLAEKIVSSAKLRGSRVNNKRKKRNNLNEIASIIERWRIKVLKQ